jgi:hypothetical protein
MGTLITSTKYSESNMTLPPVDTGNVTAEI